MEDSDKFETDVFGMRNLHKDMERQFLSFNEIIPYSHNLSQLNIYSPRLYSILQGTSAQTVAMMHLLYNQFNPKRNRQQDFPFYYEKLNENGVLSFQKVSPREQFDLVIEPFKSEKGKTPKWWQEYNDTKHDLPRELTMQSWRTY